MSEFYYLCSIILCRYEKTTLHDCPFVFRIDGLCPNTAWLCEDQRPHGERTTRPWTRIEGRYHYGARSHHCLGEERRRKLFFPHPFASIPPRFGGEERLSSGGLRRLPTNLPSLRQSALHRDGDARPATAGPAGGRAKDTQKPAKTTATKGGRIGGTKDTAAHFRRGVSRRLAANLQRTGEQ